MDESIIYKQLFLHFLEKYLLYSTHKTCEYYVLEIIQTCILFYSNYNFSEYIIQNNIDNIVLNKKTIFFKLYSIKRLFKIMYTMII